MARHLKPVFGALLGLGVFASVGAQAASSTLLPPNASTPESLSVGGWTVTFNGFPGVDSCQLNVGSGATPNCSPVLASGAVDSHGNLTVTFTENGGGNILSLQSATLEDLAIASEVITAPGTSKIYAVTLTETGIAASGPTDSNSLTASEAISTTSSNLPITQIGANLVTVADTGISNTVSQTSQFAPQNSIFVSKDIHATANAANPAAIAQVTQVFNVPEPASMSVLAIGFAGLAALRRRRTRA